MSPRRVARPSVLRGLAPDRHAVVEASAGTGKTFALEHLVVELLLATDATLDELLVVTFTEKATSELRARVRAKLEDLLSGRVGPATDEQIAAGDFWTLDDAALGKVKRALHAFDGATIATIHAFCHRVLRENAFASGRLFDEQQVDGRAAFGRALREALRRHVAPDPARAPWLEEALRTGWSMERIEKLLWSCATSRSELRPVFDAPALAAALAAFPVEAARRAGTIADLKAWGVHASTAGSIARQMFALAEVVELAREAHDPPRYVTRASELDLGKLVEKLQPVSPRPGETARLCVAALALARATPPFPAALVQALLPSVAGELARGKRETGRFDFDDMLTLVDEALRGPRGGALAAAMRRRWRYALIDEFQDTDETQWAIFRRAFFEPLPQAPPSVLYLVGDPKQSIYRFRGADVDTYLRACDEVAPAREARVSLDRNFRATRALVDATNRLFDQSAPEPIFSGQITYAPVDCGRPDRDLVDGDGRAPSPVHVLRVHGKPSLPALGALIAREIRTLTDPARPWRLDREPIEHHHVYVLTRNAWEGRAIGAELRAAGVPHAFFKEDGLFQTDEARDVCALLAAIDDPGRRGWRFTAWLTPFFSLPLVAIERARELPPSHPLVARLHAWKALADARDFDALFESVLMDSAIVRREIFFSDGERELTNYLHVLELLLERTRGTHVTLGELVRELSGLIARTRLPPGIEGNVQRLESERRAVQIMTMHKAKGLEAPVVFVAGGFGPPRVGEEPRVYHDAGRRLAWVGSLSPGVEAAVKREEREEDQRLMYVALTRAMGRLYLPCVVDDAVTAKAGRSPGGPAPLRGAYDCVNRRVAQLERDRDPALTVEDVPGQPAAVTPAPGDDGTWRPPLALLRDDDTGTSYAALRASHAAAIVTSYTRMKGQRGDGRAGWVEQLDERRAEKAAEGVDEAPATTLRAARASGVFLHEVLERVSLASFVAPGGLEAWRARPEVSALFAEAMAAYRVDAGQREHAERIVWAAYTTEVALPGGDRIAGLARAARAVREMGFVYPIPEADPQPRAGKGYVRGSLDLAFEHRGLTYFVDWKSDSLASYAPGALSHQVAGHYAEQVKLYTLAIVRLLGARGRAEYDARFGGLLYCFLRGLNDRGQGVWSARPGWDEVVGYDEELRATRLWGTARAPWAD